jgi:hypothetical protein
MSTFSLGKAFLTPSTMSTPAPETQNDTDALDATVTPETEIAERSPEAATDCTDSTAKQSKHYKLEKNDPAFKENLRMYKRLWNEQHQAEVSAWAKEHYNDQRQIDPTFSEKSRAQTKKYYEQHKPDLIFQVLWEYIENR